MNTRDLLPVEWKSFFDCFSRRFLGRPMTLELAETVDGRPAALARHLPLIGVTVELADGRAGLITVMLGDSPAGKVVHVVRGPCRVRVAQISNGEDEVLIIDSSDGSTARIDLRPAEAGTSVAIH